MKSKEVTIYVVYKGQVVSIEAKETQDNYIIHGGHGAFDYRSRIPKTRASLTPEAAIHNHIGDLNRSIANLTERIIKLKAERDQVLKLLEK